MKHLILTSISAIVALTAMSQTYNMEITLKDGSIQTIPADNVSEVRFVEASQTPEEVFNILTEQYIPDNVLRAAIKQQVAAGQDILTNLEAAEYSGGIVLDDYRVQTFDGIEYFTSLTSLIADGVFAKSLDLSALSELDTLSINRSQVESLKLGSEKLQKLNIGSSMLRGFDISTLPSTIKDINVEALEYTSLDFSLFPDIEIINCAQNQLTELKVAGLTKLKRILFTTNQLTDVSFAGCSALEFVAGSYNMALSNIDLTGCSNIRDFMFMYTALESFDATPFSESLVELNLGWTNVKTLNISGCSKLTYLAIDNCGIRSELDFSKCVNLDVLRVDGNEMPNLDLSNCRDIAEIQCSTNSSLKSIKLADHLAKLFQLNIDNVPALESFEWGQTDALQYANIYMTPLTKIDISKVNRDYMNIYLDYNDNLKEVKVWEGFDFDNPPTNIQIPQGIKFVTEFTEE